MIRRLENPMMNLNRPLLILIIDCYECIFKSSLRIRDDLMVWRHGGSLLSHDRRSRGLKSRMQWLLSSVSANGNLPLLFLVSLLLVHTMYLVSSTSLPTNSTRSRLDAYSESARRHCR